MVRGWYRTVTVNGSEEPSLTTAAVARYCETKGASCAADREPMFELDYKFVPLNLLEFAKVREVPTGQGNAAGSAVPTSCGQVTPDPRLAGWVVVLGGFHSGSDRHDSDRKSVVRERVCAIV